MKEPHLDYPVAGCLACSDPGQLPGWLAAERARADELAARSREVRVLAVEADGRVAATDVDDWRAFGAAQRQQRLLHGEANAYAQHAGIIRAHADRVELAHPRKAVQGDLLGEVTS